MSTFKPNQGMKLVHKLTGLAYPMLEKMRSAATLVDSICVHGMVFKDCVFSSCVVKRVLTS